MIVLFASMIAALLITDPERAEEVEVAKVIVESEDTGQGDTAEILENAREAEKLTITSDRCDFDRTDGVVLFDGSAALSYSSGYTMNADRLYVFFIGSNEFDRVEAEGSVVLTNETRVGMCERAAYSRSLGIVDMFGGSDGSLARLAEQGADEIAGRRIRFFVDTEQVEVSNSTLTFERGASATDGKTDIERKLKKNHKTGERKKE